MKRLRRWVCRDGGSSSSLAGSVHMLAALVRALLPWQCWPAIMHQHTGVCNSVAARPGKSNFVSLACICEQRTRTRGHVLVNICCGHVAGKPNLMTADSDRHG